MSDYSEVLNFESLKFNPFDSSEEILTDKSFDPDLNFFNSNIGNLDTPYISHEEHKNLNVNGSADTLFILHLNIRSIKKNFENFNFFLFSLSFDFSVICFSETWLDESSLTSQSLYELPNCKNIHQIRNYGKGSRIFIYIKNSINFKPRPDLSIDDTDVESVSIELLCNKNRNTLINVLYRPLKGFTEPFEKFLNCTFRKTKKSNKKFHLARDFNVNVLDHDNCKKVQNFLNLLYQNNIIPIINKSTSVTKKTATAIDHIITNCFIDTNFKTAIFKSDINDYFPICVSLSPMIDAIMK